MKEIKAYVHRSRVADVIAALKDCPAWGGERGGRRHNLAMYLVKGTLVDQLVAALQSSAHTGQPVAGWITVTDLARVIPIS